MSRRFVFYGEVEVGFLIGRCGKRISRQDFKIVIFSPPLPSASGPTFSSSYEERNEEHPQSSSVDARPEIGIALTGGRRS
jgi:hypothetical protein